MMAYKPWAYYFVVLFSRGMLRDPRFAQIPLQTGAGTEEEEEEPSARHLDPKHSKKEKIEIACRCLR